MVKRIICWFKHTCYKCDRKLIDWGAMAPSGMFCPVCDLKLDKNPAYNDRKW